MSDASAEVDGLRARFVALGFGVADNAYFELGGLLVFEKPPAPAAGMVGVVERSVFISRKSDSWEVRVTPHGGPHWVRRAATAGDVEVIALEVLRATEPRWAPSALWNRED
jgi:hypothetical protein